MSTLVAHFCIKENQDWRKYYHKRGNTQLRWYYVGEHINLCQSYDISMDGINTNMLINLTIHSNYPDQCLSLLYSL